MSSSKAFAIKRITKDLKEIQDNPIGGVGICLLDPNDPFQLLVNIKVMQGRYKDLLFHILLILPQEYPCKPPRMLILPGQPYDHSFHHHIYPDMDGYFKFCIDLLDAAIMNANTIGSGWSPGYTFCTLLMQIQNFLADPDFHSKSEELSDAQIKIIHNKMKDYTYTHSVGAKKIVHSTQNPYPPLQQTKEIKQKPDLNSEIMNQIKERISCFMTKENFIENPKGVYGYPLFVQRDKFNRLQQKPIPEILSYEGFKSQLDQFGLSGYDVNHGRQFKTGMGEAYNAFLPVFLNKQHYEQSKKMLVDSFAAISSANSFELQVIQVLPNLINKMLVALLNDSMHQSISAIEAYVHFTQLFHYLVEDNASLRQEVDQRVKNMITSDRARSKQELGDIGEFLVILSASEYALTPSLLNILYREYFARQIFWIPKNGNHLQAYLKSTTTAQKLASVFQSAIVSNKLLIFNIEAAEKFAMDKEYLLKLSKERYSVISETEAYQFIKDTNSRIAKINTHVKLMDYLGLDNVYPDDEACFNLFKIAIYVSNNQKYTNFTLQLKDGKSTPETLQINGDYKQPVIKNSDFVKKSEYYDKSKKPVQQQEQKKPAAQNKITIDKDAEEQKRNQDNYDDSEDEEQEDEWHTVSDSKNKQSTLTTTQSKPAVQKQQNTTTQVKPQPQQTKQPANTTQNKVQQPVVQQTKAPAATQQKSNNDDDEWNVVADKKKKN